MNFKQISLQMYAPVILRLGLAGVFIWFGTTQFLDPGPWTSFVPDFILHITGMSAASFVFVNSIFEIIAGILLVFGIWIRPVAALLFLHMCGIILSIGLSPIGMRDIAIAFALLSVTFHGDDILAPRNKRD